MVNVSPEEFEAAIPDDLKCSVMALTLEQLSKRFGVLVLRFSGGPRGMPSLEERQEFFLIKKRYLNLEPARRT